MTETLAQMLEILRRHLPEFRERYGIRSLAVFGSYVRGEQKSRSDLDILVEFGETPVTLFDFLRLEKELSELLGVRVDLVEKTALKPAIGRRILQEAIAI